MLETDHLSVPLQHAVDVVKQQAYENLDDWVPVNELSTARSLHDHPYSVPEQSPQQLEFPPPVTLQGIKACIIHMINISLDGGNSIEFSSLF